MNNLTAEQIGSFYEPQCIYINYDGSRPTIDFKPVQNTQRQQ